MGGAPGGIGVPPSRSGADAGVSWTLTLDDRELEPGTDLRNPGGSELEPARGDRPDRLDAGDRVLSLDGSRFRSGGILDRRTGCGCRLSGFASRARTGSLDRRAAPGRPG